MQSRPAPDYASVFSVLAELIEIGFVVLSGDGEIEFASDKARELLGCGETPERRACHAGVGEAIDELLVSIRDHGVRSIQKEIRVEAGARVHHVSLSMHPIEEDHCTGYLLMVKNAENMRRMATDLRQAAQFRTTRRLYQSVVEDLKQPVSAVMLHADLIRGAFLSDDTNGAPPREVRSLDVIRNQIEDLNRTLTLLLEEVDPADTEEQAFSLRDVVEDVVHLIEPQASLQAVDIDVATGDHAARLNGLRQRVKQAILNLAVNALDAMPEGGTLSFCLTAANGAADLVVTDTGVGIDPKVLPHIFELHFTTKETGTGVGLHVAREVISRHGGALEVVSSEPGTGTSLRVRIPVSASSS